MEHYNDFERDRLLSFMGGHGFNLVREIDGETKLDRESIGTVVFAEASP